MDKVKAYQIISQEQLDRDEQRDLLMFLAEEFDCRVIKDGKDITYFLATNLATLGKDERNTCED